MSFWSKFCSETTNLKNYEIKKIRCTLSLKSLNWMKRALEISFIIEMHKQKSHLTCYLNLTLKVDQLHLKINHKFDKLSTKHGTTTKLYLTLKK